MKLLPFALLLALATPALAQLPPAPAPSTTHHHLTLDGHPLDLTATVAAIPVALADGKPQGEVVATSFTLDGANPDTRPVVFAVNGGPGAASAYLDLGAIGPWRLPFAGPISPSQSPVTIPNDQSWLPFADLVFLDPPGTGWARILGGAPAQKRLWSVNGDIPALGEAIAQWLAEHHRLASPHALVGESYGGFRGPRLVIALRNQGVGIGALVLISPALEFGARNESSDPWSFMTRLPSYAAIVRDAANRDAVADIEAYAEGDYLTDFTRGLADPAATARMSARVAALTQLDPAFVARHAGRLDAYAFLRERGAANGTLASYYDGTVAAGAPFPERTYAESADPILDALRAPLGSAVTALYADTLHWRGPGEYELLDNHIAHAWDYGSGPRPDSTDALRRDLALDPRLRVVVLHGLDDLVTPYFATKLLLDQIPTPLAARRLRFVALPGGHMFYSRDASRAALEAQGRWAVTESE